MNKTDKMFSAIKKHLENLTPEQREKLKRDLADDKPKGWLSIEEHRPHMYAKDIMQGYSNFTVRNSNTGEQFVVKVSDGNTFYYWAIDYGITHWLNL